ncbi:hypothetical protein CMI47_06970 [Candidatus Pacearchaeota archaeon]|nr:hypothetical protein [Candidatus Pacearchaeota archaeon]|tara:strand:- start:161 stop:415 length:255 start_codon:yes stop_codon:yes gene_type:complete
MDDGIFISSNSVMDMSPLFCPVCDFVMNNASDDNYFSKYECCTDCAIRWAESNSNKWISGWRPTKKEILAEIKKRKLSPPSFQI